MDVSKAFFRYLRGELLNGYYIRKLNLIANKLISLDNLKSEFLYWMKFQFDAAAGFSPIRHNDLKGIAQVGGILSLRGASTYLAGWFRLSENHVVSGKQRSERGLYRQATGELEYLRTAHDTYPNDIATIATSALRMSLIPAGTVPVGYIWGDLSDVLSEAGMVSAEFIHETPPDGYLQDPVTHEWYWPLDYQESPPPIYAPWYGNQFLPLPVSQHIIVTLPDYLIQFLFEQHQKINYNGLGIGYLFDITESLISDLITDLKLELLRATVSEGVYTWYYKMTFTRIEEHFEINDGWGRFSIWVYLIQSKYPFIQFNETGE